MCANPGGAQGRRMRRGREEKRVGVVGSHLKMENREYQCSTIELFELLRIRYKTERLSGTYRFCQ